MDWSSCLVFLGKGLVIQDLSFEGGHPSGLVFPPVLLDQGWGTPACLVGEGWGVGRHMDCPLPVKRITHTSENINWSWSVKKFSRWHKCLIQLLISLQKRILYMRISLQILLGMFPEPS